MMSPLLPQEPYCTNNPTLNDLIERNRQHQQLMNHCDCLAYELAGALSVALEDPADWQKFRPNLERRLKEFEAQRQKLEDFEKAALEVKP